MLFGGKKPWKEPNIMPLFGAFGFDTFHLRHLAHTKGFHNMYH